MVRDRLSRVEEHISQRVSSTVDGLTDEIVEIRGFTQELAELEKRKRAESMFRRAVGRIRHTTSSKVFSAWRAKTIDRVRQRNLARRAISRFRNLWLGQAYDRWSGAVRYAQKKRQDMQLEEQAEQLQEVLSRLDPNGACFPLWDCVRSVWVPLCSAPTRLS